MLRFPFCYYAANIANFCENSYFCATFMVAVCMCSHGLKQRIMAEPAIILVSMKSMSAIISLGRSGYSRFRSVTDISQERALLHAVRRWQG